MRPAHDPQEVCRVGLSIFLCLASSTTKVPALAPVQRVEAPHGRITCEDPWDLFHSIFHEREENFGRRTAAAVPALTTNNKKPPETRGGYSIFTGCKTIRQLLPTISDRYRSS